VRVFYLFTAESVYIHVTSGDVGSEVGEHDPQNIWNPQKKKLQIFRRGYIIGILTSKANTNI